MLDGDKAKSHQASKVTLWKRLWRRRKSLSLLLATLMVVYFLPPLPDYYRDFKANSSLLLTDRNGTLLRRELSSREGVNVWVPLKDIPPVLIDCVLAAEDKRFYYHPGVDPVAIARAAYDNFKARRIVSGASTITQQLLRTLKPHRNRFYQAKLEEAYWSTRLEWLHDKDDILEAYLNRVAFGPSVYGVEEASRYYFGKPAQSLSSAEAAALAVTIRSPSVLDPFSYGGSDELNTWSKALLDTLRRRGVLSVDQADRAKSQELELSPTPPPFLAPHFCDLLLQQSPDLRGRVTTSLDLELQNQVEGMVRSHLALLREHKVGNAAVVVVEVESGEILALVGSAGYHRRRDGQHNAAAALRQPGSTIKPFTYALLMQNTGQAGTILPDLNLYEDSDLESFVPQNYDRHFHGPVSIRTSLACSYNVPAVRALERVGSKNLLQFLQRVGFSDLEETPEHYGLGLTLGNGSASLLQLVEAFRVLAASGSHQQLSLRTDVEPTPEQILDPRLTYLVTDVLRDREARIPSFGTPNALEFPFPVAVKTGTSKGFRDNWCLGYTPKHVVGVWVGNSDGAPMRDVSGITGAGPLFRDVMLTLDSGGDFDKPRGLKRLSVCALSGEMAQPEVCPTTVAEYFLQETKENSCQVCLKVNGETVFDFPPLYQEWAAERGLPQKRKTNRDSSQEFRFVFPLAEDIFLLDPDLKPSFQRVKFRIVGGKAPFAWEVDGESIQTTRERSLWWQLQPGDHTVRVRDSQNSVREVRVGVVGKLSRPGPSPGGSR